MGSNVWSNTEEAEAIYIHKRRYQQYPRRPAFPLAHISRFPGKLVFVFATLLRAYSQLWLIKPLCAHTHTHILAQTE